jgi:hypothetical protein
MTNKLLRDVQPLSLSEVSNSNKRSFFKQQTQVLRYD